MLVAKYQQSGQYLRFIPEYSLTQSVLSSLLRQKLKELKMKYISVFLLVIFSNLAALSIDQWQNIRFSEQNSAGNVYLRTDVSQSSINTNRLVYNSGSGNTEMDLSLQSAGTYQAMVNAGTGRTYYGLRKQVGGAPMHIVPLRYTGSSATPALNLLTKVNDDPANDQATANFDILAEYVTISDSKLIVGLECRGGGFPTSGGFFGPYYSYMVGIGDPTLDDPYAPGAVAWALHYINVAGIYTAGLYKITGTSISDINRIGAIQSTISGNTLIMSCDLSLLMNDSQFTAWYNPDNPSFGLLSLINTISLSSGATQLDISNGGVIHPVPLYVDPQTTPVGQIQDLTLNIEPLDMYFSTQYTKAADRFNWGLSYRTEDGRYYPMYTDDPEYATVRNYRSANLIHVFPEVDQEQGRVWVERIPDLFQQSDLITYSFVRGVNEPENLQMEVLADQLLLSWDPVIQTPLGASIQADYYVVEYASDPYQDFTFLSQTEENSLSIPLSDLGDKAFFKVKAHKIIP
jgi:hypothetical protein